MYQVLGGVGQSILRAEALACGAACVAACAGGVHAAVDNATVVARAQDFLRLCARGCRLPFTRGNADIWNWLCGIIEQRRTSVLVTKVKAHVDASDGVTTLEAWRQGNQSADAYAKEAMGGHGQQLRAFLGHVKRRHRELSVFVGVFQRLCVGVVRAEHELYKVATAAGTDQS
eukprot:15461493-Alexandrium_andersonii.AAC.1